MNCHDFTTPIKTLFIEKLASVFHRDISGIQLFGSDSEAAEAVLRSARVIKYGKYEIIPRIADIFKNRDMLLVVDEILAGTGCTGKMFCVEHYDVIPDIIVLDKGVAGGFPISAFAIKEEYNWALDKSSASTTYGENLMSCAAAYATLQVTEKENLLENVKKVGAFI